jgi:FtsP/CotA-like multicopper oxidase with cupredoxin domain
MAGENMKMNTQQTLLATVLAPLALALAPVAGAKVTGIGGNTGTTPPTAAPASCTGPSARAFDLTARAGHITLGDGNSLYVWGYSTDAEATPESGVMQYPGPTMIVCEGDTVTVTLHNQLPDNVSIAFPGQAGVTAGAGAPGLLTNEVLKYAVGAVPTPPTPVTYTFVASRPGTFQYQSATQPEVQMEMGLVGALIVRPQAFDNVAYGTYGAAAAARRAYASTASGYDVEYLFFESEMDRAVHEAMSEAVRDPAIARPNFANLKQTLWFLNGRNGPDTMIEVNAAWLPNQPYNALAQMHPGDRLLMRIIGAGRDLHPFHHHGNNAWVIARDGRVLESVPNSAVAYPDYVGISDLVSRNATLPNQAVSNFTIQTNPGSTYDALFTWTGRGLNWDVYANRPGHVPGAGCTAATRLPFEDPASHCQVFPVTLPEQQSLTFGGLWSGSQYLGQVDPLPPLQGGLNPQGGFSFMWHSHTERELTNDDIFPGGMMTMLIVQAADSGATIE